MPQQPPADIKAVFNLVKNEVEAQLAPLRLTIKSCGTKDLNLSDPTSSATGYWASPSSLSSKPPRWIIQLVDDGSGLVARFAVDPNTGKEFPSARNAGYINNRDGTCAVTAFRVLAAVESPKDKFVFPGWEWLVIFGFGTPLQAGTSGDPLTNFDPQAGTVEYGGAQKTRVNIETLALVKCPASPQSFSFSYDDATVAIANLLDPKGNISTYDGAVMADRVGLAASIGKLASPAIGSSLKTTLTPPGTLIGIAPSVYTQINASLAAGKRNFILWGPPGTGKTTLAEHMAREFSDPALGEQYVLLTASSSWSNQDLVGGYQPLGPGSMGFIPGAMLRNFDRPIVIDELNRCPIDKVIGPMFSILSGQATTLPYRIDVTKPDSEFYTILPKPKSSPAPNEFAPSPFWMMICTLNTIDKAQLGQISYALCRRFAWIKIDVPDDLQAFVVQVAQALKPGLRSPAPGDPNPVAAIWAEINKVRPLGGAPYIDLMKAALQIEPTLDLFRPPGSAEQEAYLNAFQMNILPLLDGIAKREASDLIEKISTHLGGLTSDMKSSLARGLEEQSV